jgi:hypothetical protein
MAWIPPPIPAEPRSDRWWRDRQVYELEAAVADARQAKKQAEGQVKRLRQLKRRVERVDEAILLAQSADEARRHLRSRGIHYEPRSERSRDGDDGLESWRSLPVEHSGHLGRVLQVWR